MRRPEAGLLRIATRRFVAILILYALPFAAGCSKSTGGSADVSVLGDLDAEIEYALTAESSGAVRFVDTITLCEAPGQAAALIVNGERLVYLPFPPGSLLPEAESFIRYHELGHHYADHLHRFDVGFFSEFEADAYATRVLYELEGAATVEQAIAYVAQNGVVDASHPFPDERANYMDDVLAALELGLPTPPPPVSPDPPITVGQLEIANLISPLTELVIDGVPEPTPLLFGECRSLFLPPGTVSIEWVELDPATQNPTGNTTDGGSAQIVVGEITL